MLRNTFLLFTLVVLISVLGCRLDDLISGGDQEQDFISAALDSEFQLEVGQVGVVESENIKITFLEVTADSRCPSDVTCIWAGEVEVLVNIWKDDQDLGDSALVGQAANGDRAAKTFDGYSVKLLKVDPYPISTQTIGPSDYTITLIVTSVGDQLPDYVPASLDREFQLEVGQMGFVESGNIKITFLEVTSDSRCPSGIPCIWAGEVEVLVNIWKDGLDLGDSTLVGPAVNDDRAVKTFDGYSVKLLKVDPYPTSAQMIGPSDYIITLIVTAVR